MTQEAVNNAKVLCALPVSRKTVEQAQALMDLTPELARTLESPVVPLKKKYAVIDRIFALEQIDAVLARYFKVMCRIGSIDVLSDIFRAYYALWDQANHIVRAELVSAAEPTEEEIAAARTLAEEKYPDCRIELTQKIDESLIGGYIVRVGYQEYDNSYAGRLQQLQRKLIGAHA